MVIGMRNRILVTSVAFLAIGLVVGLAVGAVRWRRPPAPARFVTSAVPLAAFGLSGCEKELEGYGYSSAAAIQPCRGAKGEPAFHIAIVNTGSRGAFAPQCLVQAIGTGGTTIQGARVSAPIHYHGAPIGGSGPHVDVGNQVTFDWFLPADPRVPIFAYKVSCDPDEYSGPPI